MVEQNFKDTRDVNGEYEGKVSKADVRKAYNTAYPQKKDVYKKKETKQEETKDDYNKPLCFLVDGYNLMHSIEEFDEISRADLTMAREKVIDLLCDYKAIMKGRLIAVFDAYLQPEAQQDYTYDGINVVYTKQGQLADSYIEQLVPELIKDYKVTVITNDALEQALVFAHGALRMSCDSFIQTANEKLQRDYHRYIEKNKAFKHQPLQGLREKLYNKNEGDNSMIKLVVCKNYEEASDKAFEVMKDYIKPGKVLGLATGSTPLGLYSRMVKDHKENGVSYKEIKSFNLDEYVGLPITHPESYYAFMHKNLFDQIDIIEENTHVPSGLGENLEAQAKHYDEMIDNCPVDIQLLGIGSDGHIAFNEPGTAFNSGTHVTDLAESTIKDNCRFFENDITKVPTQAVTQGIGTIMKAKNILLIATGANKAQAVKDMMEGPIDEKCPASVLQKHESVIVICDEEAASLLTK